MLGVVVVEGGRRLVEDQQLHVLGERLRDLHELLLADAELTDRGRRVLAQAHPLQQLGRLGVGLVPVDQPAADDLVAEEQVLRHRQGRDEGEFLMDDDDAGCARNP